MTVTMVTPDFEIKQGATAPVLRVVLETQDGTPIPLQSATIRMRKRSGRYAVLEESMTLFDADTATWDYRWQAGDTDEAGTYYADIDGLGTDNRQYGTPSAHHLVIVVTPAVQSAPP